MWLEPLVYAVQSVQSWGLVLLAAAVAVCAPVGHRLATRRAHVAIALVPAALALGALLTTNELYDRADVAGHPATITSTLGVPVIVTRSHPARFVDHPSRPTLIAVGAASALGAAFLVAMWRAGRPRRSIQVDAAGLTWWPARRHGPRLVAALALSVLVALWLLTHTDRGVLDPAFRPAVEVGPLDALGLTGLALMAILAGFTGGPAFRRIRLTSDALLLERADGRTTQLALLDLAYAESHTRGIVQHRDLVLHLGHAPVRRAHVVCADGSSDEEVEQVRAAILEARIRASVRPAEVPEPPDELLALRQSPAARSRAASER